MDRDGLGFFQLTRQRHLTGKVQSHPRCCAQASGFALCTLPRPAALRRDPAALEGCHVEDVQEVLGHSDFQTTSNIYVHVVEAKRDEETKALDDIFDSNRNPVVAPPGRNWGF